MALGEGDSLSSSGRAVGAGDRVLVEANTSFEPCVVVDEDQTRGGVVRSRLLATGCHPEGRSHASKRRRIRIEGDRRSEFDGINLDTRRKLGTSRARALDI